MREEYFEKVCVLHGEEEEVINVLSRGKFPDCFVINPWRGWRLRVINREGRGGHCHARRLRASSPKLVGGGGMGK